MITLLALITSGCSSLTGSSGTATPTSNPNVVTLAPTAVPSVASAPTGVSTTGQTTTISASVNQNVPLQMDSGGYYIKVQSQGYMEIDSANQGFIAGINAATGGTVSTVMQYTPQSDTFKISNVNAPYTVTITKLPLANPASTPKTFTGTGPQVTDPITLKKGTATIDVSCPDTAAGSDIQMFQVHLVDGANGDQLGVIASNMKNGIVTNYQEKVTFDVPADGVYLLQLPLATSPNAQWTMTVSQ